MNYESNLRRVIIIIIILIIAIFVLSSALIMVIFNNHDQRGGKLCLTFLCIQEATIVLSSLDELTDPCDDFYQFSCGGFLNRTTIPQDKVIVKTYESISDKVIIRFKNLIEEVPKTKTSKITELIRGIYSVCINSSNNELEGVYTLRMFMKNLGKWPLLDGEDWNEGQFEWTHIIYKLRKIGFNPSAFIRFDVTVNGKNTSQRIISLDKINLRLNKEDLLNGYENEKVKAYLDYMVDVASMFAANRSIVVEEMIHVLELDIALAKISLNEEKGEIMTVERLQEKYPFIPWLEYLNKVLDIPDIEIDEDELINVNAPYYLYELKYLLRRTSKRIQANFIMRNILLDYIHTLSEEFRESQDKFISINTGRKKKPPQWKECTFTVLRSMPLALYFLYTRKYYQTGSKEHLKSIATEIKTNKLAFINQLPDHTVYEKRIESHYLNLDFFSDSYIKTMLAVSLFQRDNKYKQLKHPVKSEDLLPIRLTNEEDNPEILPTAFQDLFLNNNLPRYINYAGLAYLISNDMKTGLADIEGQAHKIYEIKQAYLAYQDWIKNCIPERRLPALRFTSNQMFWISLALKWCRKATREIEAYQNQFWKESTLINSIMDVEYFKKDFKCNV